MDDLNLPEGKKIVLFDGICNLCDKFVQYLIKHDRKDVFRFVSLQSDLGKSIVTRIGLDTKHVDSVIYYDPGVVYYYKSAAVIEIAKNLGSYFTTVNLFRLMPRMLADRIYDHLAKNRYKLYGRKSDCMIQTPDVRHKFL